MNLKLRNNAVMFLIRSVLMFKSVSVRSPREPFKRLPQGSNVGSSTERIVKLHRIPGNSVTPSRMSKVTVSQELSKRLSTKSNVQLNMTKNAQPGMKANVPRRQCKTVYGQECNPVTKQICEKVHYKEVCR